MAWLGDSQHRAGLGVALAIAQEVAGLRLRQDHQVALDVVVGQTAGVRGPAAFADGVAGLEGEGFEVGASSSWTNSRPRPIGQTQNLPMSSSKKSMLESIQGLSLEA